MKHLIAASLFCLTSLAHAAPLMNESSTIDDQSSHHGKRLGLVAPDSRTAADVVMTAMAKLDIPYRLGGTSREAGFDCSGLVHAVFQQTLGLVLPRRAAEQAASTERIDKSQLRPGDLVFFNTLRRSYSHVGIYIGDNKFIHAPRTGARVRVENMDIKYWRTRFDGARRVNLADASTPARLNSAFASNGKAPASTYQLTSAAATTLATLPTASHSAPDDIALIATRDLTTSPTHVASHLDASSAAIQSLEPMQHHVSVLPNDALPALQSTPVLASAAALKAPSSGTPSDATVPQRNNASLTAARIAPNTAFAPTASNQKKTASSKATKSAQDKPQAVTASVNKRTNTAKAKSTQAPKSQALQANPSKRSKTAKAPTTGKSKRT